MSRGVMTVNRMLPGPAIRVRELWVVSAQAKKKHP
jgi:hypothetical protein